jgi:hypothetical protein
MGVRPFVVPMMIAQGVLNVPHCVNPLFSRLPFPEQDETLPAHATMRFRISLRALA